MSGPNVDVDGAGDWTVAGLHTAYSDRQWGEVKRTFKRHWWMPRPTFTDEVPTEQHYSRLQNLVADIVDGR